MRIENHARPLDLSVLAYTTNTIVREGTNNNDAKQIREKDSKI